MKPHCTFGKHHPDFDLISRNRNRFTALSLVYSPLPCFTARSAWCFFLIWDIFVAADDSDDSCSTLHREPVAQLILSRASLRLLSVLVWIRVLQECPSSQIISLSLMLYSLGKARFILLQRWVLSSITHLLALSDRTIFHWCKRKTFLKLAFTGWAVASGCSSQWFITTIYHNFISIWEVLPLLP